MAIIATGVKPDVKLPVTADITIGESGGITVNDRMQTNDENIYACGDNVEILNKLTGKTERLVGSGIAIKQARTAADNIAGLDSRMEAVIGTSIIPIFGMTAAMAGCSEATLKALQIDYRKIHLFNAVMPVMFRAQSRCCLSFCFPRKEKYSGFRELAKTVFRSG